MKPFDLTRAIAGDPLVTRDGRPAKFIAQIEGGNLGHQIAILAGGEIAGYHIDGGYMHDDESSYDLFMAPKKRTIYANIMQGGPAAWFISAYAANAAQHTHPVIARAVRIEIEE